MRVKSAIFAAVLSLLFGVLPAAPAAAAVLSESDVQNVVNAVVTQLKNYSFDSPAVVEQLKPARISIVDITNKRIELAKQRGVNFQQVSEDEARLGVIQEKLATSGYRSAFEDVQRNLSTYLTELLETDSSRSSVQDYVDYINNNPVKVLLGLTYEQRLYDFDYNAFNFAKGLRTSGAFGKQFSPLDLAISLGSQTGDQYAMTENVTTFNRLIAGVGTTATTLDVFLKSKVTMNVAEWYSQTIEAHGNVVAETASAQLPNANYRLYDKLIGNVRLTPYLLPLLTRDNNALYVISNVASVGWGMQETYTTDLNNKTKVQSLVNKYARNQANYIDFWARMLPEDKNKLVSATRIVNDGYSVDGKPDGYAGWAPKTGTSSTGVNATESINDFFAPMNRWYGYKFISAEATGENLTYWTAKQLSDGGNSAYTHELTHQHTRSKGEKTYLKGNALRAGTSTELLPRGIYETYEKRDPIYTLNQIMDWAATDYANSAPGRFADEVGVQNYVKNLLDVTNTLDLLEAQEVLSRDTLTKQKWFNVVTITPNTTNTSNNDETFTASDAAQAGAWRTVNDLVDASAVVSRYEAEGTEHTGTARYNGYYTIPLFSPLYGAPTGTNGMTGDIHMKRITWELLGAKGYSAGVVPYLSNINNPDGAASANTFSDQVALKAIDPVYTDGKALRKTAFAEREAKLSQLKPVTVNWNGSHQIQTVADLKNLMKQAVQADLDANNPTNPGIRPQNYNVENLKSAVYLAYKNLTSEFVNSIYQDSTVVTPVAPTFTKAAKCGTESTVTPATTDGITYTTARSSTKVVVNATANTGYVLKTGATASWTFDVAATPCPTVTPTPTQPTPTPTQPTVPSYRPGIYRIAGQDRVGTSLVGFDRALNKGTVVLATGANYPDGLTGGALAGAVKGPVVLTMSKGALEPAIMSKLKKAGTKKVYIVGGSGVISGRVEGQLRKVGIVPKRLAGNDRYLTAKAVVAETKRVLGEGNVNVAFQATGVNFPDALAAGAAAARMGGVVDLVKPGSAALKDRDAKVTYCAGGPACAKRTGGVKPIVGSDRYHTARLIAAQTPATSNAMLAVGSNFPDALSSGGLAASLNADLYLTDGRSARVPKGTTTTWLIGGKGVIPDSVKITK
ncbi:MAG: ZmpA/ZmpB/ZmpC family metallo-endopeptidase [Varibaculum sp.]|nr:ZmpA/ZmpB/ZmpC family metallo-endopeptidase [Varibaculum sp.]